MATTPTLMYRGNLPGTTTTLYSGTATGTAILTNIALANVSTSGLTATISLSGTNGSFALLSGVTIPGASTAFFDVKQVLTGSTQAITGLCSVSGGITAHLTGVVII